MDKDDIHVQTFEVVLCSDKLFHIRGGDMTGALGPQTVQLSLCHISYRFHPFADIRQGPF